MAIKTNGKNHQQCPLCNAIDSCAVNSVDGCWCMQENIDEQLLLSVPINKKGKSCICKPCIDKFNLAKSVLG